MDKRVRQTGEHWRVSPGLLAHTTEGQLADTGASGQLIDLRGERSRR